MAVFIFLSKCGIFWRAAFIRERRLKEEIQCSKMFLLFGGTEMINFAMHYPY